MAESMNELVERLRKQREISAQSKQTPEKKSVIPALKEEKVEEKPDEEDFDFEEEIPIKPEKPKPEKHEIPVEDLQKALLQKVANLQDNGIFRFELLQVLIEINESLKIIALRK